jgi:hypothetical protein
MKRLAFILIASAIAMIGLSSCQSTGNHGHSHSSGCSH